MDSEEELDYHKNLAEAVIFASPGPVRPGEITKKLNISEVETEIILNTLYDEYQERGGGFLLQEVAGGYQFSTNPAYRGELSEILQGKKPETLSRAALETLSIVAYKQPVTIPEVDEIRGAGSRNMIFQLMKKELIKGHGKKDVPGHPTLYVTTAEFLRRLGLNSLADLPTLAEIKNLDFEQLD